MILLSEHSLSLDTRQNFEIMNYNCPNFVFPKKEDKGTSFKLTDSSSKEEVSCKATSWMSIP